MAITLIASLLCTVRQGVALSTMSYWQRRMFTKSRLPGLRIQITERDQRSQGMVAYSPGRLVVIRSKT